MAEELLEDLTRSRALPLLEIYLGPNDWGAAVDARYNQLKKKYSEEESKKELRKAIAFAVLLPVFDKSVSISPGYTEKYLIWGWTYHQFNQRDWRKELRKVMDRDKQILEWKKRALSIGVIDPIEFQPYTRQAYNWLREAARKEGLDITPELDAQFRGLVMAYGGEVISNIFSKHKKLLKKVLNWRSGYFFEKIIYEVYTIDQILKIKAAELKSTNNKYVRKAQLAYN